MLIYEKKVNTAAEGEPEVLVRKLYGTLANVPSEEDKEITVEGGEFELDEKGRVLVPKSEDSEAEGDSDAGEDEEEGEEDEKDVVKLIYGNYKKMQFSVSGIPDFENDPEITVAIEDTSIIPEPEEEEDEGDEGDEGDDGDDGDNGDQDPKDEEPKDEEPKDEEPKDEEPKV